MHRVACAVRCLAVGGRTGHWLIADARTNRHAGEAEARVRWLTRDNASRLLAACKAHHVRLFVTLALHTGAILGLTWDRVHLTNRLVDFREAGNVQIRKRRVLATITDTLYAALAEAQATARSETKCSPRFD